MAWTDMTQLTGLVAWYKPETLAASYTNGDPIDTWADSSGNSRDLTGTTTTRPLAAASAINGYMAADFDGTDDVLSSASYTHSGQVVVSVVFNLDVLKNWNTLVNIDTTSPPTYPSDLLSNIIYNNGNFLSGLNSGSFKYGIAESVVTASVAYVASYSLNSSTGALVAINGRRRVDSGAIPTSTATPAATAFVSFGYGGTTGMYLNGKIAEAAIYNVSDDSEVPWVEGYLADKYAITLADGHLFKNEPPQNAPTTYNTGGGATNVAAAKFTRLE